MFVHVCSATRIYRNILSLVEFRCAERRGVGDGLRYHADGASKTGELVVLELCRSQSVQTGAKRVYMAKCIKCTDMYYNDDCHNCLMLLLTYRDPENDDGRAVCKI